MKQESTKRKKEGTCKLLLILYLLLSIILALPSIVYLLQNKTIYYFVQVFTYTFTKANSHYSNYSNAILYISLFFLLFFLYFALLKRAKQIFQTKKKLFSFITIVGILFSMIIPTTSLDVYSYIANGWVDSHYQENPYYTSVQDITNQYGPDQMLGKVARCWRDEPVVYGPVWSFICKILTKLSFGNITMALFIFKIAFLLLFLACSILIDRITNKKVMTLLFALNPFILFEFLSNVHNDIFLVFFMLLAIYFIKKKQNITLAVASLAIATGIKYLSILLLPFLLIYALREEPLKNKIKKTILYAIEFIALLGVYYLFYIRDLQVLSGIFVQQNKYGRSLFLAIYYMLHGDSKALNVIKIMTLAIFAISYVTIVGKLFFSKHANHITFRKTMRTYQVFLFLFTFILITNFNPWYVIWLFPSLFWQKAKHIRLTLYLSLGAISSYAITYATKIDNETVGIPYLMVMIGVVAIATLGREIKQNRERKKLT